MEISLNEINEAERKIRLIRFGLTLLYLLSLSGAFGLVDRILLNLQGPAVIRLCVLLLPWLLAMAAIPLYRRFWRKDELETLLNYRAVCFAFYGLLFGLVVVDQLQSAGFLPDFKWAGETLLVTMLGLLLAGIGWSKLRYR